jgi:hypothetical protein
MKFPLFFIIGELNGVDNVVEYAIMVKSSLKSNQVSPFLFTKLSCTMFDHTAAKYRFHGIDILEHILFFFGKRLLPGFCQLCVSIEAFNEVENHSSISRSNWRCT